MPILPYNDIYPDIKTPYFIAENAYLIGDVKIGEYCSILYGAVIRGDVNYIRIGDKTNIQDGAILHVTNDLYPLNIGDNVSIGHGAKVHGCTIGSNVLIGIGAIILDGATVGDNCIVGAGSVVREGSTVPSGALVAGVPAIYKRELTEDDLKRVSYSAWSYYEKINSH